jgi:hypothetical protein
MVHVVARVSDIDGKLPLENRVHSLKLCFLLFFDEFIGTAGISKNVERVMIIFSHFDK